MKPKSVRELYNKIGEKYSHNRAKAPNDYTELPAVFSMAGNVRGKKVLDVGCGLGKHAEKFLQKGALVTGIDASEKMIEFTQERCKEKGSFFVANFETVKFKPASFDLIVASYSLMYSNKTKQVFKKFATWLKPKGRVIFSLYHPVHYYRKIKGFDFSKSKKYWLPLKSYNVEVFNYYHPLEKYVEAIREAGFEIITLQEPTVDRKYKGFDPHDYLLPSSMVFEIRKTVHKKKK